MSKLPEVNFAADAPSTIECVSSLAKCIVSGQIVECASEDPGNMIRLVSKVTSDGADRFLSKDDPDSPLIVGCEDEMGEWTALATALGVEVTAQETPDGTLIVSARAFPWKLVLSLAVEALMAWLNNRDEQ